MLVRYIWNAREGRLREIGTEQILRPGTVVRWTSQAGGSFKEKAGRIVAFIGANEDAYEMLLQHLGTLPPSCRMKFQRTSLVDRYLVEVPRNTRAGGFDYYTPQAGVIHKQNPDKLAASR